MQSRVKWTLYANGNIERIDTGGDQLFQGQVGTTEYYLHLQKDNTTWFPTDSLFIAFVRPDGRAVNMVMRRLPSNDGWFHVSNGWETDVDTDRFSDELRVSFIAKRYSQFDTSTVSQTKTTETDIVYIHPSSGYTPLGIEPDAEAQMLEMFAELQDSVLATSNKVDALVQPPDNSEANREGTARIEITPDGRLKPIELKGATGAPGKDGAGGQDGKDGKDGEPGIDGIDGKDGADGEFIFPNFRIDLSTGYLIQEQEVSNLSFSINAAGHLVVDNK